MFDSGKMNINITSFEIQSYNEVFALWKQCEGIGLSSADSREGIQMYLDRNPGMCFVALLDGKIVGAILAGHDGRRGYIHHLAIHPDYRRKGLARQLVGHSMAVLAAFCIQKCHLFIFTDNLDGIEFWKRIGWLHRSDICIVSKNIEPDA